MVTSTLNHVVMAFVATSMLGHLPQSQPAKAKDFRVETVWDRHPDTVTKVVGRRKLTGTSGQNGYTVHFYEFTLSSSFKKTFPEAIAVSATSWWKPERVAHIEIELKPGTIVETAIKRLGLTKGKIGPEPPEENLEEWEKDNEYWSNTPIIETGLKAADVSYCTGVKNGKTVHTFIRIDTTLKK